MRFSIYLPVSVATGLEPGAPCVEVELERRLLEHEAELVILDRAPLDEAQREQHLQTAAVPRYGRLKV